MKEHFQDYGIRKWAGNDLIELQSEPIEALQKLVEPYAPCILQGCKTTENEDGSITVEAGLVVLQGKDCKGEDCVKIARFAGIANKKPPIYLTLECETESRVYGDSQSKAIAYNYKAVATTQKPTVPYMEINASGNKRLVDTLGITQKLDREGGDASQTKVAFTKDNAKDHTNIQSGSTLGNLFGKIERWFSDLKAMAFKEKVAKSDLAFDLDGELGKKVDKVEGKGLVSVDSELGNTSNPVQNRVITAALDGKASSNHIHSYLPLSGGTMTGPVVFGTASNNNKPNNYISAGGGYGVNSGKYGLKLLDFDAPDGQSGIGQDLTGYTYEMTIANCQSSSGETHITFAKHAANSSAYTRLAEIDGSGNFNAKGQLKENGQRVYSPNNKPTLSDLGAAESTHTHDYLPLAGGTITGNLRLKGGGNYGNKLNFGNGEYVYLHESTDDNLDIYAKNGIDLKTNSGISTIKVNGTPLKDALPIATTSAKGLMSADDKTKLDTCVKVLYMGYCTLSGNLTKIAGDLSIHVTKSTITGVYYISNIGRDINDRFLLIQAMDNSCYTRYGLNRSGGSSYARFYKFSDDALADCNFMIMVIGI